jgi:hypothetical protein
MTAPFCIDPPDRAVEQLWFNGVTVVAAAGNYGTGSTASDMLFSPADDPFVITVGAADVSASPDAKKATTAPWSSWGHTIDGFANPELAAWNSAAWNSEATTDSAAGDSRSGASVDTIDPSDLSTLLSDPTLEPTDVAVGSTK